MPRLVIAAIAALLLAVVPAAKRSFASEGELEWESVPKAGVITVTYKEGTDPATGLLHQNLTIKVVGAEPAAPLVFVIKGRTIGTLVTDADGRATLVRDIQGVLPGPDGRPPVHRRIDVGDDCTVLTTTGRILSDTFLRVPVGGP